MSRLIDEEKRRGREMEHKHGTLPNVSKNDAGGLFRFFAGCCLDVRASGDASSRGLFLDPIF